MYIIKDSYTRDFLESFNSFALVKQWFLKNSYFMGECILKPNGNVVILAERIV